MKTMTLSLLAALVMLSACNTMQGAGRDIESVGKTLDKTATDVKN